ncbi:MAG: ABC transporter ATP-binding protein [Lentisphaeria bacterium]
MNADTYVKMSGITKQFGSVKACSNVTFKVKKGEIYALLGENGAGKSTLMNILAGLYRPDTGDIQIKGKKVQFTAPKDSIAAGVGMIYQHFKLVETLTAKENIILGQKGSFFLNKKELSKEIAAICDRFGLQIDPDKKVYQMSVGEKQTVEILKVLYRGADILILDEPTAVLTPQETRKLFQILRKMQQEGCAIIIITHKLNEVMEISDWVSVLRKGMNVGTVKTATTSPKELTDLMVGQSVDLHIKCPDVPKGKRMIKVENLNIFDEEKVHKNKDINFELYEGEILGIAGIAGSGQKELCEALMGLQKAQSGSILFYNDELLKLSIRDIAKKGISMSFVPEDRLGMGLVASMDMVDNILLRDYFNQNGLFISRSDSKSIATNLIEKLEIKTPGIHHRISMLSGGNIQKVLLGREIHYQPKFIITAYPTRGLDIGSSHLIYDMLNEQKERGTGILYAGEDLDVLMELCDRIMVICDGAVTGIVNAKETNREELGFMMAGKTLNEVRNVTNC